MDDLLYSIDILGKLRLELLKLLLLLLNLLLVLYLLLSLFGLGPVSVVFVFEIVGPVGVSMVPMIYLIDMQHVLMSDPPISYAHLMQDLYDVLLATSLQCNQLQRPMSLWLVNSVLVDIKIIVAYVGNVLNILHGDCLIEVLPQLDVGLLALDVDQQ